MSLFNELKRRNVFRVGIAYLVASWLLLQIADVMVNVLGLPEIAGKFVFLLLAIGFIPVLMFSWAYELTPEGIKREKDVDHDESITQHTAKKLDKVTIALLIAVIAVVFVDRLIPERAAEPDMAEVARTEHSAEVKPDVGAVPAATPSIAVLPFTNMSPDPDNEYFSEGMSEELLNLLVQVKGLRVPSRTSSFAFKDKGMDIREIAQQLDVDHVLEGSVRKSGNRVRITAQLIDVSTDTHLWSNTYDRELEDIFAIQDEISREIIRELQLALGGLVSRDEQRPTGDLQAYEEYLRGRHLFMQRGVASLNASLEALQSAVARDPEFSEAWAALSQTAVTLSGWDREHAEETNRIGLEAGERALQLDANSATALAALGLLNFNQGNWQESLEMFERAEPLAGVSTPVYWHGLVLQSAGYIGEALVKFGAAERLDPVYPQLQYWLGLNAIFRGENPQARIHFQRTVDGGNPNGTWGMLWVHLREGDIVRAAQRVREISNSIEAGNFAGTPLENEEVVAALFEEPARRSDAITTAQELENFAMLAWLDAYPEIMDFLEERMAQGRILDISLELGESLWAPEFAAVRQMPEFKQLLRNIGLVELWQSRGWPDLCQPVGEEDFECD